MIRKNYLVICLLFTFFLGKINLYAQCTEQKDPEMAKYMKLTKTQDSQGCSQCGMLAFYFCSAKYCVKIEDKRKVGSMISDLKKIIKQMGEPYCCPEYLTKEPEWGIMVGQPNTSASNTNSASNNNQNNSSSNSSNNNPVKSGNSNNPKTSSGSSNDQTTEILKTIVSQLETNPDNPLNIDSKFINDLSEVLPEGTLKSTLKSYAPLLGNDENLSYRQVYNDIGSALEQNPTLNQNNEFSKIQTGINIVFNNSNLISDNFKNGAKDYKPGVFLTDPNFTYGLNQITGSYSKSAAIGLGVELIAAMSKSSASIASSHARENYVINDKFKNDYSKLAEISNNTIYTEIDTALNKALVDAMIHFESNHMINSIYRFDFDNGAILKVENDILKFIYPKKNISKNICVVEKRHDNKYYKDSFNPYKEMNREMAIAIAPDEESFFIFTGKGVLADSKCSDCLERKSGYRIDSNTGEIINEIHKKIFSINLETVRSMKYKKDQFTIWGANLTDNSFGAIPISSRLYKKTYGFHEKDFYLKKVDGDYSYLDDNKQFIFNGTKVKMTKNSCPTYTDKNNYNVIETGDFLVTLFIGNYRFEDNSPMYSSSLLQISNFNKFYNSDGMTNELTGIAKNNHGDFYFTNSLGQIGRISAEQFNPGDPDIASKIRNSFGVKIFQPYDFIAERKFISVHGNVMSPDEIGTSFPCLKFTPDEKWLIYFANDNLSVINPNNLNETNNFRLTFQPTNSYFGKENGDYILYLQGYNDYKFYITKKYSIKKLTSKPKNSLQTKNNTESKNNKSDKNNTKTKKEINTKKNTTSTNNQSLAEEILKLKELLDSGVITQAEFEAGKKKLLEK